MFDCSRLIQVEGRLCAISAGLDKFNRGGVIECLVVPEESIVSIPSYSFSFDDAAEASLSGTVTLKTAAQTYRFYFTPETATFTEAMQEDDSGTYFDQIFTAQIPKDRPEITWLKYQMRHRRYAIFYRDQNGIVKVLRNHRFKFDLDIKKSPGEYNGHTMYARRAALQPALHWPLTAGQTIEGIFQVAVLALGHQVFTLPSGIQSGDTVELDFAPLSQEAAVVIMNDALKLRLGTHYTLTGTTLQLLVTDEGDTDDPSTIHIYYAYEAAGATEIGAFANHIETYSAAYLSGETFTLPSTPISQSHLYITYNDSLALRPGTHFTLSGADVSILFAASPSGGDEDIFHCHYQVAAGSITINGWKSHIYKTKFDIPSGTVITLPNTPKAGSLLAWYDESLRLRAGTHYNISGNEVTILFDIPVTGPTTPTILDFWYAY